MVRAIPVLVAVAVLAGGWAIRPRTPELSPVTTGDPALLATIDARHRGAGHRLAVAVVDGDSVRYAGHGAGEHSPFEVGSMTKGLTGLLLAEAVRRGEVRLDEQVGSLLPLPGATATLEELATHRSGLPRIASGPIALFRGLLASLRAANPYPYDVDALLAQARAAGADGRGEPAYSNLGAVLLGQALAGRAGLSYPELLAQRVFEPLGMTESSCPSTTAGAAPPGYDTGRRKQDPWVLDGYAPAGGVVSTTGDLVRLAQALLDGTGVDALAPRQGFEEGDRIGMFWLTSPLPGTDRNMVWHNGGTGGYASFIGVDLAQKRAVVVLSDVAVSVDDLGAWLLASS